MRSLIYAIQKLIRESSLARLFFLIYFSSIIVGWLLLQLPSCVKHPVDTIDTFFMVASGVSTTGLATLDIGKSFSFFGQLVLLLLIQIGGIAYMIFSSFIFLKSDEKKTLFYIVRYTFISEVIGMILLYFFFEKDGVEYPFRNAIFHSISAFCTAGLSLFSSNLEGFSHHFGINMTLSLLSLLGAFGFPISLNLRNFKFIKPPSFTSIMILISGLIFLLMLPLKIGNSGFQRALISYFQVISTFTTAGFNSIDIKMLTQPLHFFLMFLMLAGISLTNNTIHMRGKSLKTFSSFKKFIRPFIHYLVVLSFMSLILLFIEKQPFLPLIFETASALCTTGLSMGITSELSSLGKSLLAIFMLTGRIGVLLFGFSLSQRELFLEKNQDPVF